ncbi:hypothetical protein [Micromonospora globbae]|uniref:hypothetical protein n=1 Tax=Micromonospora globbae TaxID=1894969 RepID=UPI0034473F22
MPIPGAPPPLSREGAAVGLAFLDMALRQNHIRRLTERLTFVEHGVASRTTEVDVRLSLLDPRQREASHLFQRLSSRSARTRREEEAATPTIWVPVTRISRLSVSPIDVVDAAGNKLPRLTQYETSRLLASGLYRLLKGILTSQPESRRRDSGISRLLRQERARWLIQAALIALLTERSRPLNDTDAHHVGRPATQTDRLDERDIRELVLSVLRAHEAQLEPYFKLVDVALNDYLLVAALDVTKDDHLLSYDAPVHLRERAPVESPLSAWSRSTSGRYCIQYLAQVPAGLRSYHIVAETEAGVHIEAMSLVTDVDATRTRELATDLKALAQRVRKQKPDRPIETRLLELELQGALGRLSELFRSRQWDANEAGVDVWEGAFRDTRGLIERYLSAEDLISEQDPNSTPLLRAMLPIPAMLERAAEELREHDVGSDFSVENDPASSRAHAYWRRSAALPWTNGNTSVKCTLVLRDATGARPGSVIAFAVAVSCTIWLMSALLAGRVWPYGNASVGASDADAIVAVLLLVPGFLYTRLDLPLRHTILGHLRRLTRWLAHLSIGAAVGASAAVAAGVQEAALNWVLGMATALPLVAAAWLRWRLVRQRELAPVRLSAPGWLRPTSGATASMDAVFQSSGSHHG